MSYANTERNAIQDRADTWDQILVSQTGITGDSVNVWANCGPERTKWRNMQPFDTEPEWEALWYKVSEARTEAEGYEALKEYWAHAYEICATYFFMHYYADVKYTTTDVNLQIEKTGLRWLDSAYVYLINK